MWLESNYCESMTWYSYMIILLVYLNLVHDLDMYSIARSTAHKLIHDILVQCIIFFRENEDNAKTHQKEEFMTLANHIAQECEQLVIKGSEVVEACLEDMYTHKRV